MVVRWFATDKGRCPARAFIDSLEVKFQAAILADLAAIELHGDDAPVSRKTIKGHRPMVEIRTGQYRTFYVMKGGDLWVLGACKKQDQEQEIENCDRRMAIVLEG